KHNYWKDGVLNVTVQQRYDWSGRNHSVKEYKNPYSVGWEWLSGTGERTHHFTPGDPFTELLKQHSHIQETRGKIMSDLQNKTIALNQPTHDDYELGGWKGIPKYIGDYSTLLTFGATGNLAVTYLGSYKMTYTITYVNIEKRVATVNFHVYNSSTINSAIHPPLIGYTQWWNNNIGEPLNNHFSKGPLSKTEQIFDWTELIKY